MKGFIGCFLSIALLPIAAAEPPGGRSYENRLTPVGQPRPILADFPEFVAPVDEKGRFEAPPILDESGADLEVRAWRSSYNARGIIEMTNRLRADRTAIIVVHPWGVDDGWGWRTPEPAGVAFFCTPEKNRIGRDHLRKVVNPFLKSLRGKVAAVVYSEPGREDPIRARLYRSVRSGPPSEQDRRKAAEELRAKLHAFSYRGGPLVEHMRLSEDRPVADYFRQLPGVPADPPYSPPGFWELPVPVSDAIEVEPADVLMYDAEGYAVLRDCLKREGVRHVLLTGYCTELCYKSTTAGYDNLSPDFNVFLVGDATLATFPAAAGPQHATNAAIATASRDHLITQISWIRHLGPATTRPAAVHSGD